MESEMKEREEVSRTKKRETEQSSMNSPAKIQGFVNQGFKGNSRTPLPQFQSLNWPSWKIQSKLRYNHDGFEICRSFAKLLTCEYDGWEREEKVRRSSILSLGVFLRTSIRSPRIENRLTVENRGREIRQCRGQEPRLAFSRTPQASLRRWHKKGESNLFSIFWAARISNIHLSSFARWDERLIHGTWEEISLQLAFRRRSRQNDKERKAFAELFRYMYIRTRGSWAKRSTNKQNTKGRERCDIFLEHDSSWLFLIFDSGDFST